MKGRTAASCIAFLALAGCGPSETGGGLVTFQPLASGVEGIHGSVDFVTGAGYQVHLTVAKLHIGAVYLRLGQSNPGSANASCVGATTYGLQVPGPVDVDVLSDELQPFSVPGDATSDLDQSAEIWLNGEQESAADESGTTIVRGDINAVDSTTVVASVAGVGRKGSRNFPFKGSIRIGRDRLIPTANPAQPGQNPICKLRIVSPIPVHIEPKAGGQLLLRVDPRPWLGSVDFATLLPGADGVTLEIRDVSNGSGADVAASRNFFTGVTMASAEVYQFSWFNPGH